MLRCRRMMQLSDEFSPGELQQPGLLERLLQKRLQQAVALRAALGLPSPHTNVFRLCNRCGRRSGWPGVGSAAPHV